MYLKYCDDYVYHLKVQLYVSAQVKIAYIFLFRARTSKAPSIGQT